LTHGLKPPGFNHRIYEVTSWFQAFALKCSLNRYSQVDEEVRYQKTREVSQRKTSETINSRVMGYSVLEAVALVLTVGLLYRLNAVDT
jgi:hypothetical protein